MSLCDYEDCENKAYYARYYAQPFRCKEHRFIEEGGKQIELKPQYAICRCGLHKPSFKNKDDEKLSYCGKCKTKDMVDNKIKCKCGKNKPSFNVPNEKPLYCKDCKDFDIKTMINVTYKKCVCGKSRASYNIFGEYGKYCKECPEFDEEKMVYVLNKKCKCGKGRASYNLFGENALYCKECLEYDEEKMVYVLNKKCECKKDRARYNYRGLVGKYCKECKEYKNDMIDLTRHFCFCKKGLALYNYLNLPARFCKECKKDDMIDVTAKRCIGQEGNCTITANEKYKGYCVTCFQHYFPLDPLTQQIRKKTKEIQVRDFINLHFEGFQHDKPIWISGCDCTHKRKIDHRKLIGNTLLCIETDEFQHVSYDEEDEKQRYDDIEMVHGGKCIFIRFNPDTYKNKNGEKIDISMEDKLKILKIEIEKQIKRIENEENDDLFEIIKLFYNEN